MDKTDRKLLALLLEDSRTPITILAKNLHVSREVTQYRLERLVRTGVIKSFFADINLTRMGYIGAAFFLIVKSTQYHELKSYVESSPFVSWAAEWSGNYSIGMTIIGKTIQELDDRVKLILKKFSNSIISHIFILHRKNTFFYEKHFNEKTFHKEKKRIVNYSIDKIDFKLLKSLSINSRENTVTLANNVKLSAVAVAKRIKKLEEAGYIEKYSIFIDITKLKYYQYSIFIDNKELQDLGLLKSYLATHKSVNFIAEYIGEQFFEFGIFVKEPYELKSILLEIEKKFPDYVFTRIALLQKEFVSTGPPRCVFE